MAWLGRRKLRHPVTGEQTTSYYLAWRERGAVRTRTLGILGAREAKRALDIARGRLAQGLPVFEPTLPERCSAPTVREYFDVWLLVVERDKATKTYLQARTCASNVSAFMGQVPIDRVDYALADRFVTARRKSGRRSRTVQLDLRALRQALDHARKSGLLVVVPELPRIKDTDKKPHRWLTVEQTERLLAASKPPDEQPHVVTRGKPPLRYDPASYLSILMAVNLGMRSGEILSRGWEDVRWGAGLHGSLLIGPKPACDFQVKTRRTRTVPLTPELQQEMRSQWEALDRPRRGWIFPSPRVTGQPRKSFKRALKRACRDAGIAEIHPHALRHTWASRLAVAGVDRRTLMELGGWKDGRMLDEVYAHVTDAHLAEVMARMGVSGC